MPTIFFHGGAPKTGTSYLQVIFSQNCELMASLGTIYPKGHLFEQAKRGDITSGNGVELANYIRPHLPHVIKNLDQYAARFESSIQAAKGKDILYSSEFLEMPLNDRTQEILDIIKKHGYTAKYIYFVRDIAEAAFSTYSQQVKRHGEHRTFSDFMKNWDPLYRHTIQTAANTFGVENILVYNFDEHRDDLAGFFFRIVLGLDEAPEKQDVVNRSLSAPEADILRLLNKNTFSNAQVSNYVTSVLMNIEKDREDLSITPSQLESLDIRFRAAVEFVNGFVQGRPTVVFAGDTTPEYENSYSEFELFLLSLVGQLIQDVKKT